VRDFNRGRSGGGRDFKRRDFNGPQTMHQAICSNCGKTCEVPFKPNGSKPVFCRECFQSNRTGSEAVRSENNYQSRRPSYDDRKPQQANNSPILIPQQPQYKEQFEALNSKLDKILNLLIVQNAKISQEEPIMKKSVKETLVEPKTEEVEIKTPVVKAKKAPKKSPAKK
jgi:CxxC-x17-CxxC domain-containing protein